LIQKKQLSTQQLKGVKMDINFEIKNSRMKIPFLLDILMRTENNDLIAKYYNRLLLENVPVQSRQNFSPDINEKANRIRTCGKCHEYDEFAKQGYRDLQRIYYCKDKFCQHCQKIKALSRLKKFAPILDDASDKYDLYHIALTVPNCNGDMLKDRIDRLFGSLRRLTRYLTGDAKIKGVDFLQYGFAGAVRSLETTYSYKNRATGKEYHPHLHCVVALKKDLDLEKHNRNKFSLSHKTDEIRLFSDLEILIQKVWFLLNDTEGGKRVNLQNIENVKDGYTCVIDKINDNSYYEVFKYVNKVYGEDKERLRYSQFKTLTAVLKNRRVIQGSGIFYKIQSFDDEIDESFTNARDTVRAYLLQTEQPYKRFSGLEEVFDDMTKDIPDFVYLNMKSIYNLPKEMVQALNLEPANNANLRQILTHLKAQRIDNNDRNKEFNMSRLNPFTRRIMERAEQSRRDKEESKRVNQIYANGGSLAWVKEIIQESDNDVF
jgi:plasmid rolling circle replication initiator protein Rep